MRFRCERDVLGEALATAARAAQGRAGSQPVLAGVRLVLQGSRLEITGTDLELTIQKTIEVNGEQDGACVVPGRLTSEAVRTLAPGAVTVDASGDTVDITSDRSSFTVRPFAVDDFPRLSEPAAAGVTLPASTFVQAVSQVERAASKDESRPILTGVLLTSEDEGLRLVATDSYRLAVCDLPEVVGAGVGPEGPAAVARAARAGAGPARGGRDHVAPGGAGGDLRSRAARASRPG